MHPVPLTDPGDNIELTINTANTKEHVMLHPRTPPLRMFFLFAATFTFGMAIEHLIDPWSWVLALGTFVLVLAAILTTPPHDDERGQR